MSTRELLRYALCIGLVLAMIPASLLAQCANIADPGFESLALGDFNNVVSPQFTAGYWGDESAAIVDTSGACQGVVPYSGDKMLKIMPTFGTISETWQAVPVGSTPINTLTVSAWFNACESISPRGVISVRTFNNAYGWGSPTSTNSASLYVDTSASTWEKITVGCVEVPADTQWVLIDLGFDNGGLGSLAGYIDDVQLRCNCDVVANESTNWGSLKALYN